MDSHSRSPESPSSRRYRSRRDREGGRRRSRSWSRSRSRDRSRDRRRRSRSRSRSRDRIYKRNQDDRDSYKDLNDMDYPNDRDRYYRTDKKNDRDKRDKDYRGYRRGHNSDSYFDEINSNDSFDSDLTAQNSEYYRNQTPTNKIIILGLAQHITEADINNDLIHYGLTATSIRLIRKRKTGASRGFAFVEFNTEEEATCWMEYKQGVLMVNDQYRAVMQYSSSKEPQFKEKIATDWYCAKCGVFNFKRRENCFKCYASREESEKGGEGSDEVSNILTKKIMLRNLDVLTNEEGVLTVMQEVIPTLVSKIAKILICRDRLTSTSRGICYLSFDNLVDSMNVHNALKSIDPPLQIDNREVTITYCVDSENRQLNKNRNNDDHNGGNLTQQYTMADVPRLAEYSASVYAKTPEEHDHFYKYYTDYYKGQISKGHFSNLPTISQMCETANSGAAVALSAIQRKQKQQYGKSNDSQNPMAVMTAPIAPAITVPTAPVTAPLMPKGNDGKTYPTPDVNNFQYDETSGYYYDPVSGLYYDPNSQYYYNGETGSYMYWDLENSTYILAPSYDHTQTTSTTADSNGQDNGVKKDDNKDALKKDPKQDKVKVAKKIVKDMEKWAKQLNQKKEMSMMHVQSITREEEVPLTIVPKQGSIKSGYADVGFSILENKERTNKITLNPIVSNQIAVANKFTAAYGSDSDNESNEKPVSSGSNHRLSEKDLVDFEKLTCLLCKRAFQSLDILQKHIKMSQLHKDNLQKLNLGGGSDANNDNAFGLTYRDRAKERRLKYGESDPPPPNKSRERFERELKKQAAAFQGHNSQAAKTPIGGDNVGNKLLQKMGWTEGQGLGRSNQGRTEIIEAESRSSTAGLGTKSTSFAPGDDYKSYIKRMMKSRYEQVDVKD